MVTNRWREKQGSDDSAAGSTRCQQVPAFSHWLGTSYVETLKKCNIKASGIIQKLDYFLLHMSGRGRVQAIQGGRTNIWSSSKLDISLKERQPNGDPIITHATDAVLLCGTFLTPKWVLPVKRVFFSLRIFPCEFRFDSKFGQLASWPHHDQLVPASVRGQLYRTLAKIRTGRLIYAHPRPQIEVYTSPINSLLSLLYFILIHSMKTTTMLY